MIELEIHLAAPGSVTLQGRVLPRTIYNRVLAILQSVGTVTHSEFHEASAHAEFFVDLPGQWNRVAILQAAARLFRNTPVRGSLLARFEGRTFFQLSTPGGTVRPKWREGEVPTVPTETHGELEL